MIKQQIIEYFRDCIGFECVESGKNCLYDESEIESMVVFNTRNYFIKVGDEIFYLYVKGVIAKIVKQKTPSNPIQKGSYIDEALKKNEAHTVDSSRFVTEQNRMLNSGEIPRCSPTKRIEGQRTHTYIGKYAFGYLKILKDAKESPNMTLGEYFDIEIK